MAKRKKRKPKDINTCINKPTFTLIPVIHPRRIRGMDAPLFSQEVPSFLNRDGSGHPSSDLFHKGIELAVESGA